MTHIECVRLAERWLMRKNCKIVIRDDCRVYTSNREQPDVIGWRSNCSILIECKVSRQDFLADKHKAFREDPSLGMGDHRFYACPPNMIQPEEVPEGWGLLWLYERTTKVKAGRANNCSWGKPFFIGNKQCENEILVSVLRRLTLRGYLPEIYDGMLNQNNSK